MNRLLVVALGTLLAVPVGCRRTSHSGKGEYTKEEAARIVAEYEKKKKELAARPRSKASASKPSASAVSSGAVSEGPASPAPKSAEHPVARSSDGGPWILDEPIGIAPAGPVTATVRGVVLYDRNNNVHFARLGGLSRRARSMRTPVSRPTTTARRFPLGRGPAVVGDDAYWISEGSLLRRQIPLRGEQGPLEVLARDARTGTRVAAHRVPNGKGQDPQRVAIAYITRPTKEDGPLLAKILVEGSKPISLTPEGSSANSISLVQVNDELMAVSLQARTAVTPVHVRRIRFAKNAPVVGDDIVVWVGGGVQPLTELTVLESAGKHLWGFVPHERSITEFGLAELDIGVEPDMSTPTQWILYPNGLDPSPVATGHVCGEPAVAYVQPQTADPDSPQELVVRTLTKPIQAQAVARAKAFFSVSMVEVKRGALIAYVADWATWARTIRCRKKIRR